MNFIQSARGAIEPAARLLCLLPTVFAVQAASGGGAIIYVDASAPPGGFGSSWENALTDLDTAFAIAGGNGDYEIRVAAGRYVPGAAAGFEASAQSGGTVRVLGGFPVGGGDLEQRDPATHQVVLSGDTNGDDFTQFVPTEGVVFSNRTDNRARVLRMSGQGKIVVDGVAIEGGYGVSEGAGVSVESAGAELRSVTIRECATLSSGGGLRVINGSNPIVLQDCTIERCGAEQNGGGAYIQRAAIATGTTFRENSASRGGALWIVGPGSYEDCHFVSNVGLLNDGAVTLASSDVTLGRCGFTDNYAGVSGGAMSIGDGVTVTECAFTGNEAALSAGALRNASGGVVERSTFSGNRAGERHGAISLNTAVVEGCRFEFNSAAVAGGAGRAWLFQSCVFEGNDAPAGGAVLVQNGDTVTDCEFRGNAAGRGGALTGDPGLSQNTQRPPATISRCLFLGNHADLAGGAVDRVNLTMDSCVFIANTAALLGGAIDDCVGEARNLTVCGNAAFVAGGVSGLAELLIDASILWGNIDETGVAEFAQVTGSGIGIGNSIVEGLDGHSGSGNSASDPVFRDPVGPDGAAWSGDEDLRLDTGSPAIDAGGTTRDLAFGFNEPLDRGGAFRFVAFAGGIERPVDIGAFEAQDCDADGVVDGPAVSSGAAEDCNGDGIPDPCSLILDNQALALRARPLFPADRFRYDTDGERLLVSRNQSFEVFKRSGDSWAYEGELQRPATLLQSLDYSGSVAIDGDLAVVGLPDASITLIYRWSGSSWVFEQQLPLPTDVPYSGGLWVDASSAGDRVITSGNQSVRVYSFENGEWVNITTAPSATLLQNESGKVQIEGDRIVTRRATFERQAFGGWVRQSFLMNPTTGENLVTESFAMNEDWLVVGDRSENDSVGAVYVYSRSAQDWENPVRLEPEIPVTSFFGEFVAVAGDRVVVGSPYAMIPGAPNGYIEIFEHGPGGWERALRFSEPDAIGQDVLDGVVAGGDYAIFRSFTNRPAQDPLNMTLVSLPLASLDGDGNGLVDECENRCNSADIAEPFGTLDLQDVSAFVTAFTTGGSSADLAPPQGVLDIADIAVFVTDFVQGCE